MARRKSSNDLFRQSQRIYNGYVSRGNLTPTDRNRLRRAEDAFSRYNSNIANTRQNVELARRFWEAGNDAEATRYMRAMGETRYSRSTYMGINNG